MHGVVIQILQIADPVLIGILRSIIAIAANFHCAQSKILSPGNGVDLVKQIVDRFVRIGSYSYSLALLEQLSDRLSGESSFASAWRPLNTHCRAV